MPGHLKALVVILVIATAVFAFAKAPACANSSSVGDFNRRRNLWVAITLVAFLAHNFWYYIVVAGALLLAVQRHEPNKPAMYFFVLLAIPAIPADIGGMGIVQILFAIDYVRLLALTVLLPATLYLWKQPDTERFGRSIPDKLIAGYLILIPMIMIVETIPFTITLRHGIFYPFIDFFLPYYVASRWLKNFQQIRDSMMALWVATLMLGATLVFESRGWLLYNELAPALGAHWGYGGYLGRGAYLRVSGPVGHPIHAGYVMAVAIGFYLYLRNLVPKPTARTLGWGVLIAGLIVPVSRGPWVGTAAMLLVFIATSPAPAKGFAKLALFGVVAAPLLLSSSIGQEIIDHLPFVGTVAAENVVARQRLADASFQVFLENPVFGRYDFVETPEMEALRGIDGLIDIVNTYVLVGLANGLVGLSLFAGFFLSVIFAIYKSMRTLADRIDERYVLGQALISTLLGILVIIGTVNPIPVSQAIYWSLAGLGVAYARMVASGKIPETARAAELPSAISETGT